MLYRDEKLSAEGIKTEIRKGSLFENSYITQLDRMVQINNLFVML